MDLCTVTQVAGLTTYRVTEVSPTNCHYTWCNGTKFVLANHVEEPKYPVVKKNTTTLITNECLEKVYYIQDCISEGILHEVNCNATCSGIIVEPDNYTVNLTYWICVALVFCLVLVLLVILIVRCRKARFEPVNRTDEEEQGGISTVWRRVWRRMLHKYRPSDINLPSL